MKTVSVSQTDNAGNTGTASRGFVLDTVAPQVKITQPAANASSATGLTLSGTCETTLQVMIAGSGVANPGPVSCAAGTFSASINFSNGDGFKTVTVNQTDSAGNTGTDSRDFLRDSTVPSVRITAPAAGAVFQAGLTLEGSCETGVMVNLSGTGLNQASSVACLSAVFSAPVLFSNGDGNKVIVVTQTDSTGNSAADTRTFVRDGTPPQFKSPHRLLEPRPKRVLHCREVARPV